ncbi:MAG: alternate-type signal peptide domain-containing protein [Marmoricola sp.]
MKKSTKGALAAAAAGTLLLGGAGSLAYWTDSSNVSGTSITSGYLDLGDPVCTGGTLHDWQIDGGAAYDPATMRLVPGDTLTKKCTITVNKAGTHFTNADFTVAGGTTSGSAELFDPTTGELTLTAAYSKGATSLGSGPGTVPAVAVSNGDTVTVDLTIAWPYGAAADNTSNDLTGAGFQAALADITITAKQNHN